MFGAIAALVSAALCWFGTGLHPLWFLTWLAPLPVLWYARTASWRAAALVAFAAWFAGGFNMWGYMHGLIGLPAPLILFFFAIPAVVFALAVLAWRREMRAGRAWRAALLPALVWVTSEYLATITSPHATFGSLAYTQMYCLPMVQIASLTGIYGISFLLWVAPSALATRRWRVMAAVAVLLAAVVGFGVWRLRPGTGGDVRVALIASDAPQDHWAKDDQEALAILSRYAAQVESVHRADIVVLPEDLGPVPNSALGRASAILGDAARRAGVELVAGLRIGQTPPMLNEALVFGSDGTLRAAYEKHHLIPGLEDGIVVGSQIVTLPGRLGLQGVQICKDLDFPALSREYGRRGVGLLLVPAWDFDADGWLHGRMAVLRGVENGFAVARAARNGLLTLSTSRGLVTLERATSRAGFVVAEGAIREDHDDTLYTKAGDWFAWVSIAALAALLATGWRRRADLIR
jgi:apolipoprotein N-acyltransferase